MNPSLREQLDSLMRGIRVSVPAEVADDIEKRIESYAATREAEGRIDELRGFLESSWEEVEKKVIGAADRIKELQATLDTGGDTK